MKGRFDDLTLHGSLRKLEEAWLISLDFSLNSLIIQGRRDLGTQSEFSTQITYTQKIAILTSKCHAFNENYFMLSRMLDFTRQTIYKKSYCGSGYYTTWTFPQCANSLNTSPLMIPCLGMYDVRNITSSSIAQ